MARAKQLPAAKGTDAPYDWAVAVLRLRFDEVFDHAEAVLGDGEVGEIHDLRVAIRRLRTAMSDLSGILAERPLKRVKHDLKNLAEALGTIRDQDVAILLLQEFAVLAEKQSIRDGIDEMIDQHRKKRKRAHSRLQEDFDSGSFNKLRDRFSKRIADSISQPELFDSPKMRDVAKAMVMMRLQKFRAMGDAIRRPLDAGKLHELRIAAKRLRYTIELFGTLCGDEIASFAPELAKLQSHLGDVHDCDIWTETLRQNFRSKGKAVPSSAVSAWLLSKFVSKRSKSYRSALETWRSWETNNFRQMLPPTN